MRENVRAVRFRVGKNVKQLRSQRGLSQEGLAELAGNTWKHIGQVERGEVNVTVDILTRIAAALSVPSGELFGPTPPPARGPRPVTMSQRDLEHIEQSLRILRRAKQGGRRRERSTGD